MNWLDLDVAYHPRLGTDLEIFLKDSSTMRSWWGIFLQFGPYLWEKDWSNRQAKCIRGILLDKKVLHRTPDRNSDYRLRTVPDWPRRRSAFSECACFIL